MLPLLLYFSIAIAQATHAQDLEDLGSSECNLSLTDNIFDAHVDELAHRLHQICASAEYSTPLPHLAMLLGYRKVSKEQVARIATIQTGRLTDLIPICGLAKDLHRISSTEMTFKFPYEDRIRKKTHLITLSVDQRLNDGDLNLIRLSQRSKLPYEAGEFRFHFDESGLNYYASPIRSDAHFRAHRIVVESDSKRLLAKARALSAGDRRVVAIEYIHTHPYDSLLAFDDRGNIVLQWLNLLSFKLPIYGDLGLAILI